ncbi:uncharacterized protein LOC128159600 isoform X3 [Crassostrea angulata]|uniref:uncharacterized protein LOC128159600 isoform X3 n=1 Tax=Magallana angulata TaxID=2784310 RepID=UPI0022B1FD89|nr:uncharacterized protein LOC128159600 isoform X3 [Crassostrea angulata]
MDETTRLKEIEERAAIALYANDAQNAWELYSEAASICLKNDLEEDYKRVLSCKSMMATMLQRNEEALLDSISYFMLDQRTEQGYWLAAMSHIKHGKKNLALGYFLKGFKIALEPSLFLVEIVRCLVTLRSTKEKEEFTHLFGQHRDLNVNEITTDTLKRTLQKLNETESWKCLCLLVIGKHPGPKTDFDKLACQCPASHIFVGKMLNKLSRKNKQKFGFQLAIAFLNNGASVKEIENVYETPAVHVGLRMFLETDQTSLNNIIDDWTNAEIIQHANKLFDQSRFNDALESYIKAREMLTSEENDVEIQCNIIECYLNMKDYKRALELCLSVNESSCGPGIEKVNVLRGYALKGLKNWPEAFYAFLNVAIKFQDKGIFEKDIVVNIADTYIEYSTFDDELDTVQVERLCDRMKCYIVWELVKRAYWNVAHRFFKQTAGTGSNSRECAVMIISDLKPICTFAVLSEHRWLSCFITCLIKNGMLEFRNIKYKAQRRKSYKGLHACVMISSVTGDTSLVDLVSKQAKECFQHNEQDSEGNTALHLAVFVYRDLSEHAIAQTVVECLLMNGINPLLKNHESNTARNCIAETNKELSKILLKYETRLIKQISKEEEMNERKRKFEIWKLHEENPQKIDNFKTYVFVKVDETPSEKVNSIYKCDCKFTLQKIKESGNISEEQKIGHLIEVIRKDHRLSTHHKVQHECVSLIANAVSKEDAPEIMKTMLEISEPVYEAYLHELCHLKRWEELHKILKSYRGKLSNSSLQMLARSCSIYTLIEAVDKEETIAELLEIFLEGKNIIIKDDGILVNDLLKRKMFRVLRVLFHHDVDPTLLRIYPGDTAIHAAVCIGFQFEHENFAIFGDFVEMYNRDKMNYKCLNPCQLDDNGDSLVDMISNEPETPRKRKLMETLKDLRVPEKSNVTNDENTTYDYQDEKMSINVKIERLEQHLLDEISKLSPGIFNKSELRPIVKFSSEKTNQQNQSEMECERNETGSSFDEVDLKSFESLPWEIECTSGFKKAINSRHVPVHTKKRAFECIKKLAEGYREPHLCKALHHNGNQDIKLFEIKLDKAVRIIWENAINFSPRCNNMSAVTDIECDVIFSEVIRIWDIVLNHDRIHACVENITESYKQCNIFRLSYSPKENYGIKGSTELELPKLFTKRNTNKLVEFKETERNFYISVNPNVTKFYDVSPDLVSHALKYLNNDVDLPFKVTDLEYLFIKMKFDAPILLLGRSGTGKTTCCIYKLWAIFEEYWRHQETKCSSNSNLAASKHSDGKRMDDSEYSEENQLRQIDPEEGLRQLFVTKNPILCSEAERNFIELRKSSSVEKNFSPSEIKTSYETLQEIGEKGYPLFLTYKQLIELLDVSIGPPFYLANENLVDWSDKNNTEDLAQFHNNDDNFSDFSSEDDEFQSEGPSEKFKSRNKLKFKKHTQRKLLTYEIFERDIWMKIKKSTTCHASLVWTEVRSFIKGSFAALNSSKGHLTLEQYKEIGKKVAPLFQDDRELIYEMFKSYERVKKHSHYIDEGDVTFNLFHRMRNLRKDVYFHEVYVDETQDFTNAELCILMQLCSIPNRIFLTGDTAQCIMQGISFRFKDLQALLFKIKENGRDTVNVPEKLYHLPHNYRSHAGILNLATSVLDILKYFFPDSFDDLGDDKGMMIGPKPVILRTSRKENLHLLLSGNERETSKIDLGAHQVVLVTKDETKKTVKSTFQKCLVLTIDCAKGLEFDDVLLFNFFKDSHANKEWRVVTSFLEMLTKEHDPYKSKDKRSFIHSDISTNLYPRPLEFDPRKHKILNTELKRLYTALTRARTNVWIFDEDEECRLPMFDYFIKRNLVEVKDDASLIRFSKQSECKDWCKQGEFFFRKKRFDLAADCFKEGSDIFKARLAGAYHEKQLARSMDEKSQKYHLMRAAHLFFQCKKAMKAEKCLRIASQYKCLGRFYERTQQMHDAADMYRKAILPFDQSRCLEYLGYFGKAISVLVDNACFDFARASLKKFTQHQKSEDKIPESLDSDSKICAKAADCFGKMQNNAQFLKFAKNIECQNERFVMYLKYNFFDEAFELNWPKGTEDKRVDFYMQCGAVQNALHILKDNTQRNKDKRFQCILIMSQIALHKKDKKNLDEIEEKLKQIIHNHSNSVTVAKAHLLIGQLMHLEQHIGNAFELLQNDRHRGMFVQIECIDWMITKCNLSKGDILEKITQYLEKFLPTAKASEIRLFLNPDSSFGQGRFDAMCAFFDFYYHKGNLFKLYPRQFPLGLKIIEEKQECQQFEIYFDKPALEHYCKTYLKTKFQCWKNKLIAAFAEKRKHFEWLNNIEMMTHFNIISIKAAICLSKLLFCDVKKQCEIFLSDLYGAVFLSTSVSRRCENVSAFLQDRDYGFIRSRIKRNLKENLENINSWNERGIADFIRFLLMAHLLDFKDILGEQLECHISHSDLSISFKHFFDSLVRIELKRAVCEFDHFCYLISKENSIPFPCDLFMLFCEMFLTTAFYIIARSHRRTCWFVVPQIYLDSLSHVENLFLKKISVLKKISHDSKSEPETDFFLKHLVHILCGFSCKLHLLKNKSKKQTEDRILALGFTVLCNLGGILTTPDCTEVESNLAREINKHLKRKGQEKILEAMSEAKFLIDFHKPLHELLNSGEHKLLWCSWDSENGLSHTTEKENHYFKDISIKPETRTAITKAEISTDSKKYEEHYILGENPQLFHEEFPKPKIDGTNICSSIKSSKRKGRKKRNTIHDLEKSGDNASLEKDESTKQRTEDCINDSNEEISTEMSIEDINSQLKTSNDNGAATHEDSDVKKVAFENGAEQNKLFKSGLLDEIKDRNQLGKENSTDCNDNFHDAKRLTDSDEKVKAIGTASCGGNAAVDTNLNQKKLDDGDQLEKNRKMNNSFGHKNLPNDNKDGFPDDKLLTDSVSIMASRDTDNLFTKSAEADETNQQMNKMDLIDRKFDNSYSQNDDKIEDNHYKKNLSINPETILPETIKSIHANDMECSDQHTQWEDDGDESLNDIRYLFKV